MRHNSPTPTNPSDMRNLIIAVVLCTGLLFVWQAFYAHPREMSRREAIRQQADITQQAVRDGQGDVILPTPTGGEETAGDISGLGRDTIIAQTPRVEIHSDAVHGSVNLQGLRFDDLTLARHRVSVDEDSPEVVLLTPSQNVHRYFLQVGWLPATRNSDVQLPDSNSMWQADSDRLTPNAPVTFTWTNPQGVVFTAKVTLDENYLFTVEQEVSNTTGQDISVMPYGLANRAVPGDDRFGAIIHTGPIGVFDNALKEISYGDLKSDKNIRITDTQGGWFGIADKYWLTAFIPPKGENYHVTFQHVSPRGHDRAQVDYLAHAQTVPAGGKERYTVQFFAGAKELSVLEQYRTELDLPLFDRALDFGILYFLTKPIFIALDYFYGLLGNFGLAIMLFVVMLKLVLFPLSNKSYRAMAQMRAMQPEIEALRKRYEHDRMKMQQEVMALWQRERVNPVSGCLPILIQLPIFFALYKVLLVTIEMRHAPFYGWIHDLSAADPTNIFTLFGLVPWNPPSLLHIGLWPIIMCASMVLQQKLNPKPTDPIQAKVLGFLPYIFLVLFASFPAGLLIYWAWNNVLSILQQWHITKSFERHQKRKDKKKLALETGKKADND